MTRGEMLDVCGRRCVGGTHVLFVPQGRSLDDVLAEIRQFGKLTESVDEATGAWMTIDCDGDTENVPCWCRPTLLADDFEWHHDDVLFFAMDGSGLMQRAGIVPSIGGAS